MYIVPEKRLNKPNLTPPARGRDLYNLYGERYAPKESTDYASRDADEIKITDSFTSDNGNIYENVVNAQRDGIKEALSGYEQEHGIKPGEVTKLVDDVLGKVGR